MSDARDRILLLGYGNPGRLDDGLGPAVVEALAARALPGVHTETDYQLQVEHGLLVAEHDVVVFVDADATGPAPFSFRRIEGSSDVGFTTHSLPPDVVLGVAESHFGKRVPAYVLAVRGYDFDEFGEGLSDDAAENARAAAEFLDARLREPGFGLGKDCLTCGTTSP